jgi:hypothetical protein
MLLKNVKNLLAVTMITLLVMSCSKDDIRVDQTPLAKKYSSDLVVKWLEMDLEMMRVPLETGAASQAAERVLAYNGIALYEAVVHGIPAHRSLGGQLTSLPGLPKPEEGKPYHWGAAANAALAFMNRKLFPGTSDANKARMDALENQFQTAFAAEADAETLERSVAYGRVIATRIAEWASTDGSANTNPAYVPPVGDGLWVPTASTPPVNPYASQRRLLVPGIKAAITITQLPTYSADPSSEFYAMAKDVYDKSLALTDEQKAQAIYHRDAPGYPGGGHFVAVLAQVLTTAKADLEQAALAFVKSGIVLNDAVVICFVEKYRVNTVRPITYIRNVMGFSSWNTLIPTPNHPEFPSAHAVNAGAVSRAMADVFGKKFAFTLRTYDYLPLPSRSFDSFEAMALDMADSRVFGGIHYQTSCDIGRETGYLVTENLLTKVRFK